MNFALVYDDYQEQNNDRCCDDGCQHDYIEGNEKEKVEIRQSKKKIVNNEDQTYLSSNLTNVHCKGKFEQSITILPDNIFIGYEFLNRRNAT